MKNAGIHISPAIIFIISLYSIQFAFDGCILYVIQKIIAIIAANKNHVNSVTAKYAMNFSILIMTKRYILNNV